jgi:hypothetical protein
MQVVHLNPIFDLQLIQMFDDGLEDFERQVEAMVAGTHPRHRTIAAIVEEDGYHERLLDYVRRFRANRDGSAVRGEQSPGRSRAGGGGAHSRRSRVCRVLPPVADGRGVAVGRCGCASLSSSRRARRPPCRALASAAARPPSA